jgi:hypothetical protein
MMSVLVRAPCKPFHPCCLSSSGSGCWREPADRRSRYACTVGGRPDGMGDMRVLGWPECWFMLLANFHPVSLSFFFLVLHTLAPPGFWWLVAVDAHTSPYLLVHIDVPPSCGALIIKPNPEVGPLWSNRRHQGRLK